MTQHNTDLVCLRENKLLVPDDRLGDIPMQLHKGRVQVSTLHRVVRGTSPGLGDAPGAGDVPPLVWTQDPRGVVPVPEAPAGREEDALQGRERAGERGGGAFEVEGRPADGVHKFLGMGGEAG